MPTQARSGRPLDRDRPSAPKIEPVTGGSNDVEQCLRLYGDTAVLSGYSGEVDLAAIGDVFDLELSRCSISSFALNGESGAVPPSLVVRDSMLCGVDLSGLKISELTGTEIVDSKLVGTIVAGPVSDCILVNCKIEGTAFRVVDLRRVEFQHCLVIEGDFYQAKLTDIRFVDCRVTGVGFDKADLEFVDLRSCDLTEIGDPLTLAGATIDRTQAIQLSAALAARAGLLIAEE